MTKGPKQVLLGENTAPGDLRLPCPSYGEAWIRGIADPQGILEGRSFKVCELFGTIACFQVLRRTPKWVCLLFLTGHPFFFVVPSHPVPYVFSF